MNGHQRQREESGRMIETALFALMGERDFAEITVSELADRAGVSRRTFYRLYDRKEEVLRGYFARLCDDYVRRYPALEKYDPERIAEDFFSFWYPHREILLLLHRCGMEELLYRELGRASAHVIRSRAGCSQEEDLKYFACYSAGGFLMLLHCWISEGMEEEPLSYARRAGRAVLNYFIR